jgi:hypothetical protein
MSRVEVFVKKIFRRFGYDVRRYVDSPSIGYPVDFSPHHKKIIERVFPHTITSLERIYALVEAVKYVVANNIQGAFVECGVYKGGSMMAVAMTLLGDSVENRDLYLYDTFEGMPKPHAPDIDAWGKSARDFFEKKRLSDTSSLWANCPIEEVKKAMSSTGYPDDRIHYVKGLVEDTIPETAPKQIALLRLDTDWYNSTKHEIVHLYPRVSRKGVIIIDDYGHFRGAKQAVDEFFSARGETPYLHRIDYTGRLMVKHETEQVAESD